MGASGGEIIALLLGIFFPKKMKAIIADSFSKCFTSEMLQNNVIKDRERMTKEQINFWKAMYGDDWKEVIKNDTVMIKSFVESGGDYFKGRLSKIECPVLLTFSRNDSFLPQIISQACNMTEVIKNCTLFIDSKGNHPLIWTRTDLFRKQVEFF